MSSKSSLVGQICQYKLEFYGRYIPTDYPKDANLNDYFFRDHEIAMPLSHEYLASSYLMPDNLGFNRSPMLQRGPRYEALYPATTGEDSETREDAFSSLGIIRPRLTSGQGPGYATSLDRKRQTYLYPESGICNYKYLDQEPWRPNMFFAALPGISVEVVVVYHGPGYTSGVANDDVEKFTVVPLKEKTLVNRLKSTGRILTSTTYLYCSLTRPSDEQTKKLPTFVWLRPEWLMPAILEATYKDEFKLRLRDTIKKIIKK